MSKETKKSIIAEEGSEARKYQDEISRQYLSNFFEDDKEPGLFQIIDVIKEPGFAFATNGATIIKRRLCDIHVKTLDW